MLMKKQSNIKFDPPSQLHAIIIILEKTNTLSTFMAVCQY